MAITRFGHLDDFTQKNNKVGIGTSTPQEKMEVIGGTRSTDLRVAGIATLTSARGFIEKHIGYVEDQIIIDAGDSGTFAVDLDTQSLTIAGTTNEIETTASGQTLTIGLPNNVTISGNATIGGNITNGSINLTFPTVGGAISTEGFSIALATALG